MLIDWFTVGAQALNFVILVWLLKHFLYKPILDAIDAREKAIAAEIAAADAKRAEAQKEHDEYQRKNQGLDRQRAAVLRRATDDAQAEHQRLLDEARQAADALSAKRHEQLHNEARDLSQALRVRTQQEVFAIARKTLSDLAGIDLERRMCEVFATRLRALSGDEKDDLGQAVKATAEPALVRSAFDLPPQQQGIIRDALNETFSADIRLRFETAPDLVSGIELTANGRKAAWSIADYLGSLQQRIDEQLKAKTPAAARPAPKPEGAPPVTQARASTEAKPATRNA